jgi:hypothetical protein
METYRNPGPIAYRSEPYEPVPGWGITPNMAGSRRIAIGGFGDAVSDMAGQALAAAWPILQPKLRAELDSAVEAAQKTMRRDALVMTAITIGVVIGAAWWVKKR